MKKIIQWINSHFSLTLLVSVIIGVVLGIVLGDSASVLKPFGTIFTRLHGQEHNLDGVALGDAAQEVGRQPGNIVVNGNADSFHSLIASNRRTHTWLEYLTADNT